MEFNRREIGTAVLCGLATTLVWPVVSRAAEMDQTMAFYAEQGTNRGLRFLRANQSRDGSWTGGTETTALALNAFVTSYQRYNPNDGPFITKPLELLVEALRTNRGDAGAGEPSPRTYAQAMTALRAVNDPSLDPVIASAQEALSAVETGGGDPVAVQVETYLILIALRGVRSEGTEGFRARAFDAIAPLQLATGGFPGSEGAESLSMTCASAASLALCLQDKGEQVVASALDRIVETYTTELGQRSPGEPAFFFYDACLTALTTAERRGPSGGMGTAGNWRDTLAYALIERQAEDGGWLPDAPDADRHAATARAVIAMNKALA